MEICKFGKMVKKRLIETDQKQEWLIREIREHTGLYFDTSYMHKILTGKNTNQKIVSAICEILCIEYSQDDVDQN